MTRFVRNKNEKVWLPILTFNAMAKNAFRSFGRTRIKLQTAPSPWVTRSLSLISLPVGSWRVEQSSSSSFMAESGRCGASPKSLLKDLSEAGRASRNDLAYSKHLNKRNSETRNGRSWINAHHCYEKIFIHSSIGRGFICVQIRHRMQMVQNM